MGMRDKNLQDEREPLNIYSFESCAACGEGLVPGKLSSRYITERTKKFKGLPSLGNGSMITRAELKEGCPVSSPSAPS